MYRKYFLIPVIGLIITLLNCFSLMAAEPFHSTTLQESSPVQVAGGAPDAFFEPPAFIVPSDFTRKVAYSGITNKPAVHEGVDFVHSDPKKPKIPVIAAADGVVAYVRTGCPQSAVFTRNTLLREAGAGWGNHVVILHKEFIHASSGVKYGIYTRYAHLTPGTIKLKPGDNIKKGEFVGDMGNSGRSEVRHLHFEVGIKKGGFITDKPSQSFDFIFDPARFMPKEFIMREFMEKTSRKDSDRYPSSNLGRASVMIKIYCGHDAQYSAGLHSEGLLTESYKECNALVWAIKDAHMGYGGNLADILKTSFPEALKKASIKDGFSSSKNARVLVAPVVYVELRSINSQGGNHEDPLYHGELKFDTVKYEE